MRTHMSIAFIALALAASAWANDSKFIKLYDSGKYDEAAKELESADLKNPDVICRAGAMYYSGLGVGIDLERGKTYLESAMTSGNASAAIKLAKIYFHKEKNSAKAAYCLLVAENAGDDAIKDEVSKLKTRFGEEYKRGVGLYIQQMQTVLKGTLDSMKAKSAEYEKESAVLRQQIADMSEEKKSFDVQLKEINDKLTKAERAKKELEDQIEKAKESNADLRKKSDEQAAASDEKLKYELGQATKKYDELKAEHDKFVKEKYDVLVAKSKGYVEQHKKLVEDHEELLRQYKDLKNKYEGNEPEGTLFIVGMGRGLATLCMSPLNYIRGFSYIQNVSAGWETNGAESGVAKIFAIPMIVFETVPFAADIVDGALDVVSFGYYGDWLYGDEKYSPWWFDRDDKVFPWIQKAEVK